jgi:hypothetical protein
VQVASFPMDTPLTCSWEWPPPTCRPGNVTIPLMFTVQALPTVSAGATSLTFTYISGGSAPPAQTVLISGSTGGFTATAASDTGSCSQSRQPREPWGTSISVSVNPAGIASGSHAGTVTIAGTNGLTGQALSQCVVDDHGSASLSVYGGQWRQLRARDGCARGSHYAVREQSGPGHAGHGAVGLERQPRHATGRGPGAGKRNPGADDYASATRRWCPTKWRASPSLRWASSTWARRQTL